MSSVKPQSAKRVQIDKAQARMLIIVVLASFVSVFALVASKAYFSQAKYLTKVAGEKEKAVKQLKINKDAVSTLVASYKSFAGQNPNLIGGASTGSAERDGDNGRLVLDALPSKYDFPALTTSLEKLLAGYRINSISGVDDASTQTQDEAASKGTPVQMPFELDVGSNYKSLQSLLTTFEKSIRPFQVKSLTITGTNANLQASISAQTFYQPAKDLTITMKEVK